MRKSSVALMGCFVLFTIIFCSSVAFSQEPVKIGFAYVFSERLAHYGFGAKQGAELAMDEINRSGGINGRKVVGLYEDTQLKPDVGVKVVQKLVTEDKVDVVMGLVSSGVASAVAPVINQLKTPLIITLAMTPDVTGKICNPYTFRVSTNGPQNIKGAAILASQTQAKKWTTLGPDYLFGYQCWEYFQTYLKEIGPGSSFYEAAQVGFAPMDTRDFTPYIKKILDTKPEGVLVSLYSGNLVDFVRQGAAQGLFNNNITFILNLAYSADVMYGLGIDMPKGLWLGGLYWFQGNDTPANKRFVEDYMSRYKVFPDYNAQGAYAGVKAYAAAAAKAGSIDKQKITEALPGLTLDLPAGHTLIRAGDHQAVYDGVWGVTGEFDGKLRCRTLKPLKVFSGQDITPSVESTGCRLP
jgi:branched-chain amino acid transport system substrate-binding protein